MAIPALGAAQQIKAEFLQMLTARQRYVQISVKISTISGRTKALPYMPNYADLV